MPGPPPKAPGTARRRNATNYTVLPREGRQGVTPEWPLIDDLDLRVKLERAEALASDLRDEYEIEDNARVLKKLERQLEVAQEKVAVLELTISESRRLEVELWNELWTTPQAKMWEELAWNRDVAQYVRWKVRAEMGNLAAAQEARQWSDRLGLNPLALLRLRWEIQKVEAATEASTRRRNANAAKDATAPKTAAATKAQDPRKGLYAV